MHQRVDDDVGRGSSLHFPAEIERCEVLAWPSIRTAELEAARLVVLPLQDRGEISLAEIVTTPLLDDLDRIWLLVHWLHHVGGERELRRVVGSWLMLVASMVRQEARDPAAGLARARGCRRVAGVAWAAASLDAVRDHADVVEAMTQHRPGPTTLLAQHALASHLGPVRTLWAFDLVHGLIGRDAIRLVTAGLARALRRLHRAG